MCCPTLNDVPAYGQFILICVQVDAKTFHSDSMTHTAGQIHEDTSQEGQSQWCVDIKTHNVFGIPCQGKKQLLQSSEQIRKGGHIL